MIQRIVKLTIQPDYTADFIRIFYETQPVIRQFSGCKGVELLYDINKPEQYFTLSYWLSEDDLENYRTSPFFKETWTKVKPLFSEKSEAWSLNTATKPSES